MELAGRRYAIPSWLDRHPLVVICLDGCDPAYIKYITNGTFYSDSPSKLGAADNSSKTNTSSTAGKTFTESFQGLSGLCVIPSFTNANNVSIVTGCAPIVHGVSGNHYFDLSLGKERPMNEARDIRPLSFRALYPGHEAKKAESDPQPNLYPGTILSAIHDVSSGRVRVAAVTSKNKLFNMLQRGFSKKDAEPRFFSVEQLGVDMYSEEATLRLLAEGYKLVTAADERKRPHVLYLSSTDYMQHKYAADDEAMIQFMARIAEWVEKLRKEAGCVVCITADHGMSAKPNVVYMSDELVKLGFEPAHFRVVLPITDPYVAHHAALGSYCTISSTRQDAAHVTLLLEAARKVTGVRLALPRAEASHVFSIPNDGSVGDIVVVMDEPFAVGKGKRDHDLRQLQGMPLRSHGGMSEQPIPLLMDKTLDLTKPLEQIRSERGENYVLRNFDIFYLALNSNLRTGPVMSSL